MLTITKKSNEHHSSIFTLLIVSLFLCSPIRDKVVHFLYLHIHLTKKFTNICDKFQLFECVPKKFQVSFGGVVNVNGGACGGAVWSESIIYLMSRLQLTGRDKRNIMGHMCTYACCELSTSELDS